MWVVVETMSVYQLGTIFSNYSWELCTGFGSLGGIQLLFLFPLACKDQFLRVIESLQQCSTNAWGHNAKHSEFLAQKSPECWKQGWGHESRLWGGCLLPVPLHLPKKRDRYQRPMKRTNRSMWQKRNRGASFAYISPRVRYVYSKSSVLAKVCNTVSGISS